jgi:hypothetical protein
MQPYSSVVEQLQLLCKQVWVGTRVWHRDSERSVKGANPS